MADSDNEPKQQYIPALNLNSDFFSRATDMTQEIFEFDMLIAGKTINENGEWVRDPYRKPLLNPEGRAVIRTILATALNKNTYMSDLRAERVRKIVFETSEDIQITLFFNRHKYGLKDEDIGVYEYIISVVENLLETAFARPIDGRERGMYNTMQSEQTHRVIEARDGSNNNFLSGLLGKPKAKF